MLHCRKNYGFLGKNLGEIRWSYCYTERSKSMWRESLKQVVEVRKMFGKEVNTGAAQTEIELLKKEATKRLDVELPEEYLNTLMVINGIEFNGYILYGIDEEILGRETNQHITGVINSNEVWYENEEQKQYIFLGESGISWYVYDIEAKWYKILDMPSGDVCEEFEDFGDMLDLLLKDSLA